jgi:hypothetical protein
MAMATVEKQAVKADVVVSPMSGCTRGVRIKFALPEGSPYKTTLSGTVGGVAIPSEAALRVVENLAAGLALIVSGLDSITVIQSVTDVRAEIARQAWVSSIKPGEVTIHLNRKLSKSAVQWSLDGVTAMALIAALSFSTPEKAEEAEFIA